MEDRLFPPSSRVTVGHHPRATFTLPYTGLGKNHVLLRHGSRGTILSLMPGMKGKIKISGVTREAEELLNDQTFAERKGDEVRFTLGEGDEGILVFGRTGLIFQPVTDMGEAPTARFSQIVGADPLTSKLFGIGFALVLLFSLVSKLFAGPRTEFTVEQLPDRMVSFVVEDPAAANKFKQEIKEMREKEVKKKRAARKQARQQRKAKKEKGADKKTEPGKDRATEKIRKKVTKKGVVGAIASAREQEGALKDVMGDGGLGISLNTAVSNLNRGSAQARLLTSTGTGGAFVPGLLSRRGTSEALGEGVADAQPATGRTGRRAGQRSRLAGRTERKVTLSMPSSAAQVSGGSLSRKEIYAVVSKNKGAIRYCYESQLMRYPTLRGKVTVDFIINTDGSVRTVKIDKSSIRPAAPRDKVNRCLVKFVKRWRFPKPRGGKVRVIYPFTFGRTK